MQIILQISATVKPNKATKVERRTHTQSLPQQQQRLSVWYLPFCNRKRNRHEKKRRLRWSLSWLRLASQPPVRLDFSFGRPTDRQTDQPNGPPRGHYCRLKWPFNILLSHHFLSWSFFRDDDDGDELAADTGVFLLCVNHVIVISTATMILSSSVLYSGVPMLFDKIK